MHRPRNEIRVARAVLVLLALLASFYGTACAEAPAVEVTQWRSESGAVELPARLSGTPGTPFALESEASLAGGGEFDLVVPSLEGLATLYVDGNEVSPAEHLPAGAYRRTTSHRWRLPPPSARDGVVHLRLEVPNDWAKSGWLTSVPVIVPAGTSPLGVRAITLINVHATFAAIAALLQIGLTCLLVYALDRRRTPYLFFAIQALAAITYPAYVSGLTQYGLGTLDLRLLEVGLAVALGSSLFFTHAFFRLAPPPRSLLLLLGAACVLSFVVVDPFLNPALAARGVVISVAVVVVYQLALLARLWRAASSDRVSVALLAAAWLSLASTTWCDLLSWFALAEPLGGVRPATLGLMLFALFLALVLSRSHVLSLGAASALNEELARKVETIALQKAETDALAVELHAKVSDRAGQLIGILSLLHSRADVAADLEPGDVVEDRYRVERLLGRGGMGRVYEVSRISDGSRWAMKVPTGLHGAALSRLAREAFLATKIKHDNVVKIRDIDVRASGGLLVVMELLAGRDLRAWLDEDRARAATLATDLVRQLASGLAALHEVGIAHRDLKPENLMIIEHEGVLRLKIVDFGISTFRAEGSALDAPAPTPAAAASAADDDLDWGATGAVAPAPASAAASGPRPGLAVEGTPHYMAPELAQGADPGDLRADLWSLGVIAYELSHGHRPFDVPPVIALARGGSIPSRAEIHLDEQPTLRDIIVRSLSLDPARRPEAAEVVRLLEGSSGLKRAEARGASRATARS